MFDFHLLGCSCTGRASLTGGGFRLRLPTFEITIFPPRYQTIRTIR